MQFRSASWRLYEVTTMTNDKIILKIRDLVVSFNTESGKIRAVDGVGFELEKGQTLGIVGESGCGKSVTAMSVLRLLPKPSAMIESGSVEYRGRDLLSVPVEEMHSIRGKKISMIFQEPMTALNPVHKIGKQIKEVYQLHFPEMTKNQIKASSIHALDRVGIADAGKILEKYPHMLSGGMRQRVMIAMALAPEPDILIADEPTTALDVTVQAQILELIKELRQKLSMSVILITHDLGVIAENCDYAVVMYAGKIIEKAPVNKLFKHPCHPYTLGLLNSVPSLSIKRKTLLPTIKGMVPSLDNMPGGCRFSTRCPLVKDICRKEVPHEKKMEYEHFAACHLLDSIQET